MTLNVTFAPLKWSIGSNLFIFFTIRHKMPCWIDPDVSLWLKSKNKIMNLKKYSYQYFQNFQGGSAILKSSIFVQFNSMFYPL